MYNKLMQKILDSSVWLESEPTRLVFVTFLAAMDQDGFVALSAVGNVAARARVSLEAATEAVAILESPDKHDPTQEHEGRRIERVPYGWMVLNASKYAVIAKADEEREKTRVRVANHRARKRVVTAGNENVTPSDSDADSDPDPGLEDNPLPPSGSGAAPSAQRKAPRRATFDSTPTPDEKRVLDAINAASGGKFRAATQELRSAIAKRGTVEDALLVVAHLASQPAWQPGGDQAQYLDPATPFRPKMGETRAAKARAWSEGKGRPTPTRREPERNYGPDTATPALAKMRAERLAKEKAAKP